MISWASENLESNVSAQVIYRRGVCSCPRRHGPSCGASDFLSSDDQQLLSSRIPSGRIPFCAQSPRTWMSRASLSFLARRGTAYDLANVSVKLCLPHEPITLDCERGHVESGLDHFGLDRGRTIPPSFASRQNNISKLRLWHDEVGRGGSFAPIRVNGVQVRLFRFYPGPRRNQGKAGSGAA